MPGASFIAKISAVLDSSQMAKDINSMNQNIKGGLEGINNTFGIFASSIKGKGKTAFQELTKAAETFAKAFSGFSNVKDPFKNMKDSLAGVNDQLQTLIRKMERVQRLTVKGTGESGGTTSSSSKKSSAYENMKNKMIDLDIERKSDAKDRRKYEKDFDQLLINEQIQKGQKLLPKKYKSMNYEEYEKTIEAENEAAFEKLQKQYERTRSNKDFNIQNEINQLSRGQQPLPKKYKKMTYDQYIDTIWAENEAAFEKLQKQYAKSTRVQGGDIRSNKELKAFAKMQVPGGLSTEDFDKTIRGYFQKAGYAADQTKRLSTEMHNLRAKALGSKVPVDQFGNSIGFLTQALDDQVKAIGRLGRYYVSFLALSSMQDNITQIGKSAIMMKDQMLEVKKFLPEGSNTAGLEKAMFSMGSDFAVPMETVLGSYTEFAKQGKQVNEIADLTKSALLGVNVASTSYANVVTYLTTATNVWGVATSDTIDLIDKLAYVQAKSSAESVHLITSMQRSAAMAKQFGLSLDEVLGYTAAVSEKTMLPGEVIGTSLKTVIERSQRLKTLQDLSQMNAFKGVKFVDPMTGDMMKANEVLGLVASKWQTLTEVQQKSIGELIAGGRQVNAFIALMENFARATELTQGSSQSWGYALKANAVEMEKFSRTWQQTKTIFIEQGGGSLFTPIINSLQNVLKLFNYTALKMPEVAYTFGTISTAILGGAGVTMALNSLHALLAPLAAGFAAATSAAGGFAASLAAINAAIGVSGWIGIIAATITGVGLAISEWTSYTNKQKAEQDSLNLSLSDTIEKLLRINKIENEKKKLEEGIKLYESTPKEEREKLQKAGVPIEYTEKGIIFKLDKSTIDLVKALQMGGEAGTKSSILKAKYFKEAFDLIEFNKLKGTEEERDQALKDVLVLIVKYKNEIDSAIGELVTSNPQDVSKITEDKTLNPIQKYLSKAKAGADLVISNPEATGDINRMYDLKEALENGSLIKNAAAVNEKLFKITQIFTPSEIEAVTENSGWEGLKKAKKSEAINKQDKTGVNNYFALTAEAVKANKEAFDAYVDTITTETERSMRGVKTPKYKMEFDYSVIEVATKKMMELQQKHTDLINKQKTLNSEIADAYKNGLGEEAVKDLENQLTALEQPLAALPDQIQRAEEAQAMFMARLIMSSDSVSQFDRTVASLINNIISSQSSLRGIAGSFEEAMGKVINLDSWVKTLINSLLSIPTSIGIQINALFTSTMGSSLGGILGGVGNVVKNAVKGFLSSGEIKAQAEDIIKESEEAMKLGSRKKGGDTSAATSLFYNTKIGELQTKVDNLGRKIISKTATPEDIANFNKASLALEEAKKSSQKDPGGGKAKHETEDKAHQAALERIHALEQKISVEKKIQTYWEGQLTDSFKRRWEREISDLKEKSKLYDTLSKEAGLKPDEVRSYQRQSRETLAEAKLMEDRRKDVEKIQKRESSQKLFNRQLEESNKLFEYQQQIKSLDFEALTTTDTQKNDFQKQQQQEKLQFAINQYAKIYTEERQKTLDAITEQKSREGAITTEVQNRIQAELEEQMILNDNVQKAKERVTEEERATVALDKRLRNEILAKAKQSVEEIKGTLSGAIQNMFNNSAAEEQLKRIKEVMDEIAALQKESEFAGYNVAGSEATGNVESINAAREKWFQVNQQMEAAQKKLNDVSESTNKWKEILKNIGDVVLKKISEKFADLIMNKTGLGDQLMNMFTGIDNIGTGKGKSGLAGGGIMSGGGLIGSLFGGGGGVSKALGLTSFAPTMTGSSTIVVNQSGGGGGALSSLSNMVGQFGFDKKVTAASGAAKTKSFGPLNYLTAAMMGYGIGSSTSNKTAGFLGGAAAGYLAGGVVGAVIGGIASLFGKKKGEEAPPAPAREFYPLAANTNALDANTRALTKIADGVFNAPSVFEMNKLQAENNAPRQVFNLNVNVSGGVSKSAATEIGNTILKTVSQGLAQSAARTTSVPTTNWS